MYLTSVLMFAMHFSFFTDRLFRSAAFVGSFVWAEYLVRLGRISRKQLEIAAWFQWTTNKKWHIANRMAT